MLQDPELPVQMQAALTLAAVDPGQAQAVPILIKAASGSSAGNNETFRALVALGSFGRLAQPAVPLLLNLLSGKAHASTRAIAAGVLGKSGWFPIRSWRQLRGFSRTVIEASGWLSRGRWANSPPIPRPQFRFCCRRFMIVRVGSGGLLQMPLPNLVLPRHQGWPGPRGTKILRPPGCCRVVPGDETAAVWRGRSPHALGDDSNTEVREGAAYLLRQAGIQGDWEARFKQMEQGHNVARAQNRTDVDQNRLYSKEES